MQDTTIIRLIEEKDGKTQKMDLFKRNAERVLREQSEGVINTKWKLDDSQLTFNKKKNAIIQRKDKRVVRAPKERETDNQSNTPRTETDISHGEQD